MNNLDSINNQKILPELIDIWQSTLQWQPNQVQQQKFQKLYREIIAANRHINLTRITEPQEFWEKHLWDSLAGLDYLGLTKLSAIKSVWQVIDIGTGGGFPGIPVAIAFPSWTVTLLDSTQKKIKFLASLSQYLDLNNIKTITARAEIIGQDSQLRESYDLALIRAVAESSVCAEYALPLVKIGGLVILYRGNWTEIETKSLKLAVSKLGGKIETITRLQTPLTQGMRHCIYLRKTQTTSPQFPRAVGIPNQHPL